MIDLFCRHDHTLRNGSLTIYDFVIFCEKLLDQVWEALPAVSFCNDQIQLIKVFPSQMNPEALFTCSSFDKMNLGGVALKSGRLM